MLPFPRVPTDWVYNTDMMAIAGAIGTGLIVGTGPALKFGPAPLLIGYLIMGIVVYIVMVALGEMGAWLPHKKSFSGYATRFVDPAFGYATGWNYFFKYVIVLPNNLTVTGVLISLWLPDLNVSVWIVVFGIVIIAVNVSNPFAYFPSPTLAVKTIGLTCIC